MKIDGSIMIPVNCILEKNLPTTIVGNQWYITVKNANDTVGKLWVPNSNGSPVCLGDTPVTDSKIASLENQINVLKSVKTIYRDFAAVNESFNQYTPIEDVISAMADYSMLIATTYRPEDIGIYPSASGELIITKSIINRTKVEFISYTGEQYIANNGDRFSGFKKVVTEDMLASMREQITATQEMLVNITSE